MIAKRVVVTGLGAVTPLGLSFQESWKNIVNGRSGIRNIDLPDYPQLPCTVAATIPRADLPNRELSSIDPISERFDSKHWSLSSTDSQYRAHCIQFALSAAEEAVSQSNLLPYLHTDRSIDSTVDKIDPYRIGVSFASGMGDVGMLSQIPVALAAAPSGKRKAPHRRISPFQLPNFLTNSSSGAISCRFQTHGPLLCPSTACAAGSHAIAEAYALIATGHCDAMIAGGGESSITPTTIVGFVQCKAITTKFNDNPQNASRPFDSKRNGFIIGEGAAALVLEEYEFARRRGAPIIAEIVGCAATSDAYHMTAPEPSGIHIHRCMRQTMETAIATGHAKDLSDFSHRLGYVNAHATSTPIGDDIELKSILTSVLGDDSNDWTNEQLSRLRISGTKSSIGHLLGGAGAIEAALAIQALADGIAPPTLNLENCDIDVPSGVNLVPFESQPLANDCEFALSNSFGFGGTNASVLVRKM